MTIWARLHWHHIAWVQPRSLYNVRITLEMPSRRHMHTYVHRTTTCVSDVSWLSPPMLRWHVVPIWLKSHLSQRFQYLQMIVMILNTPRGTEGCNTEITFELYSDIWAYTCIYFWSLSFSFSSNFLILSDMASISFWSSCKRAWSSSQDQSNASWGNMPEFGWLGLDDLGERSGLVGATSRASSRTSYKLYISQNACQRWKDAHHIA